MIDYIILAICIFFLGKKVIIPAVKNDAVRFWVITIGITCCIVGVLFVADTKIKEYRETHPSEPEVYPCLNMTISGVNILDQNHVIIYDSTNFQTNKFHFTGPIPSKLSFKEYWEGRDMTICYGKNTNKDEPVPFRIIWYE